MGNRQRLIQAGLIVFLALMVAGVVLAQPETGKDCTSKIQAGRVFVQLDEDGYSLQTVPLPLAYCGNYVVVATPQGSGMAELAEFEVTRWFVDSSLASYQFVIGVQGEPGAGAWFHYVAAASYE